MPPADPRSQRALPDSRGEQCCDADDPCCIAEDCARLVEGGCPDDVTLEQVIDAVRRRDVHDEA